MGQNETNSMTGEASVEKSPKLAPTRQRWVESLSMIIAHRKLILWTTLIVTALTAVYAFVFMPNYYTATAVVLPARQTGGSLGGMLSGITSSLKDLGLSKLSGGSGEESYSPVSLISSRELQVNLIKQFGLAKVYKSDDMDDALKTFNKHFTVDLSTEGNFNISFEDTSRVRAAQVANAAVAAMNETNSRLAKEEAAHNSAYVTERYQQTMTDLDTAEARLGAFQREHGIYEIKAQAQAELTALATLEQQKSLAEIEFQNAKSVYGANSPEAQSFETMANGLGAKLQGMQTGMDSASSSFVPTDVLPKAALEYMRLMRDFEIQSKLKAFFLPMYEQAKLDENRNLMSFVTLDTAAVPIEKSSPHRSIILLIALLGSAVLMSMFVIVAGRTRASIAAFKRDEALLG